MPVSDWIAGHSPPACRRPSMVFRSSAIRFLTQERAFSTRQVVEPRRISSGTSSGRPSGAFHIQRTRRVCSRSQGGPFDGTRPNSSFHSYPPTIAIPWARCDCLRTTKSSACMSSQKRLRLLKVPERQSLSRSTFSLQSGHLPCLPGPWRMTFLSRHNFCMVFPFVIAGRLLPNRLLQRLVLLGLSWGRGKARRAVAGRRGCLGRCGVACATPPSGLRRGDRDRTPGRPSRWIT